MNVQEVAAQYGEYLIEKRRYFHQHPEVSTKEYHTSKAIKEALDEIGVSWRPVGWRRVCWSPFKAQSPARPFCFAEIWMP